MAEKKLSDTERERRNRENKLKWAHANRPKGTRGRKRKYPRKKVTTILTQDEIFEAQMQNIGARVKNGEDLTAADYGFIDRYEKRKLAALTPQQVQIKEEELTQKQIASKRTAMIRNLEELTRDKRSDVRLNAVKMYLEVIEKNALPPEPLTFVKRDTSAPPKIINIKWA